MPQHARMNRKFDTGRVGDLHNDLIRGVSSHGTAAQPREHIWRSVILRAFSGVQDATHVATQQMSRTRTMFNYGEIEPTGAVGRSGSITW